MRGIKAEEVLPFLHEGEVISIVALAKRMRDAGRSGAENSVRAVVLRDKRFFVDRTTQRFKVSLAKEDEDDGTMRVHLPCGEIHVYYVTEAARIRRYEARTANRPRVAVVLPEDSLREFDTEGDVQIGGESEESVPPRPREVRQTV